MNTQSNSKTRPRKSSKKKTSEQRSGMREDSKLKKYKNGSPGLFNQRKYSNDGVMRGGGQMKSTAHLPVNELGEFQQQFFSSVKGVG